MKEFETIEDVDEWLEPMDYQGFWFCIVPYGLVLQPRGHCDRQIENGEVGEDLVLDVLKTYARVELMRKYNLQRRVRTPWVQLAVDNDAHQ